MPSNADETAKAVARGDLVARSLDELARKYRHFRVEELDWDWGCNIGDDTRAALGREYARRGIQPGRTRGKRRRGIRDWGTK